MRLVLSMPLRLVQSYGAGLQLVHRVRHGQALPGRFEASLAPGEGGIRWRPSGSVWRGTEGAQIRAAAVFLTRVRLESAATTADRAAGAVTEPRGSRRKTIHLLDRQASRVRALELYLQQQEGTFAKLDSAAAAALGAAARGRVQAELRVAVSR